MVFRVDRRHLNTCRAEAVTPQDTLRRGKTRDRAACQLSDGVPDGQMMQVVLGESDTIHGRLVSVLDRYEQTPEYVRCGRSKASPHIEGTPKE